MTPLNTIHDKGRQPAEARSPLVRQILTGAGLFCTLLAVLGIFVPLLPTVPLLLLAATCFARSSERFYRWLLNHPRLGPMLGDYLHGRGIPLSAKIKAIALIWLSLSISALLITAVWLKGLLLAIGLGVTLYLLRLPLLEKELATSQNTLNS